MSVSTYNISYHNQHNDFMDFINVYRTYFAHCSFKVVVFINLAFHNFDVMSWTKLTAFQHTLNAYMSYHIILMP